MQSCLLQAATRPAAGLSSAPSHLSSRPATRRAASRRRSNGAVLFTFLAVCAGWCTPTPAVIIASGDGQGNTAAPGGVPQWSNVGTGTSAGTFIYLGNRHVLGAFHIGVQDVTFGGSTFSIVGTPTRLKNPNGSDSDLLLWEIDGDPGLPALTIRETPLAPGDEITMIGAGLSRQTNQLYWDVDPDPAPPGGAQPPAPWTWTEVGSGDDWDITGFRWGFATQKRWGTNTVFENNLEFTSVGGPAVGFNTIFDLAGTEHEAQAAAGDSGGAVFYQNPTTGEQELAGVMLTIGRIEGLENVPEDPIERPVLHDWDLTFNADLSLYREEILATVPEPSTALLLALSLPALWAARRRTRTS